MPKSSRSRKKNLRDQYESPFPIHAKLDVNAMVDNADQLVDQSDQSHVHEQSDLSSGLASLQKAQMNHQPEVQFSHGHPGPLLQDPSSVHYPQYLLGSPNEYPGQQMQQSVHNTATRYSVDDIMDPNSQYEYDYNAHQGYMNGGMTYQPVFVRNPYDMRSPALPQLQMVPSNQREMQSQESLYPPPSNSQYMGFVAPNADPAYTFPPVDPRTQTGDCSGDDSQSDSDEGASSVHNIEYGKSPSIPEYNYQNSPIPKRSSSLTQFHPRHRVPPFSGQNSQYQSAPYQNFDSTAVSEDAHSVKMGLKSIDSQHGGVLSFPQPPLESAQIEEVIDNYTRSKHQLVHDGWERPRYKQKKEWDQPIPLYNGRSRSSGSSNSSDLIYNMDTSSHSRQNPGSSQIRINAARNAAQKNRYTAEENLFILRARDQDKEQKIPWNLIPRVTMQHYRVSQNRNARNMQVHFSQNVNSRIKSFKELSKGELEAYKAVVNTRLNTLYEGVYEEFKKLNHVELKPELTPAYTRYALRASKRRLVHALRSAGRLKRMQKSHKKSKK